jgi:hypothetical protein
MKGSPYLSRCSDWLGCRGFWREDDQSYPSRPEAKNISNYIFTLPYISVGWYLIDEAQWHIYLLDLTYAINIICVINKVVATWVVWTFYRTYIENSITSLQCSHQRGPAHFAKSVGAVECYHRGCFCWSVMERPTAGSTDGISWNLVLLSGSTVETSRSHKHSCLGNTEDVPILPNATSAASQTLLLPRDNEHCHAGRKMDCFSGNVDVCAA